MLGKLLSRASGVAIGTAAGQGLILLATPYLARRYTPEEFGALALLLTISNVSVAAGCLRYDLALPSAKPEDVRGLLVTALRWAFILGTAAGAGIFILAHCGWARAAGPLLAHPFLVGICVTIVGCYQATAAWFLQQAHFARVAWLRFSQGTAFCVLAVLPAPGLGWAQALSFLGGSLGIIRALRPKTGKETKTAVAARQYRQFPTLSLPGALLDVCGYSLCIWVIDLFYGHAVAGNYSQVQRLTGAPLMLLSMSVGQVLLKQTAELSADPAALRRFIHQLLRLLVAIAAVGLGLIWLWGEPLLHLALGPQWHVDRNFVTLIALAVFIRACVSPLSTVLITLRRFKRALVWQTLYFVSALALMPWVAGRLDFTHFVCFYATHEVVFYCFYLVLILRALPSATPPEQACAFPVNHPE